MQNRREFMTSMTAAGVLTLGTARLANATESKVMVSVLTAKRPHGVSYLEGTLASVDRELSCDKLLVWDASPNEEAPIVPTGWKLEIEPARAHKLDTYYPDNKIPAWRAINIAAESGYDLLFLEDDVRGLHPGVFKQMAGYQVPDTVAFTSFFTKFRAPGLHPAIDFQMSQAIKIPNRSLRILAKASEIDPYRWEITTGVDIAIAQFGSVFNWNYEQTENLIEHIGLWSAAHPTQPNK